MALAVRGVQGKIIQELLHSNKSVCQIWLLIANMSLLHRYKAKYGLQLVCLCEITMLITFTRSITSPTMSHTQSTYGNLVGAATIITGHISASHQTIFT